MKVIQENNILRIYLKGMLKLIKLINRKTIHIMQLNDIFINDKLKPFLLEVNHTPSFTTDTPLDSFIKKNLIRDTLKLINVSLRAKEEIIASRKEQLQQRVLTGKKQKLTQEQKQILIQQCSEQRDKYENINLGEYVKIFPLEDAHEYNKFIQFASLLQDNWTGANIKRNQKKEQSETPVIQVSKPPDNPIKKINTPQILPKINKKQSKLHKLTDSDRNTESKSKTQSSSRKSTKEQTRKVSLTNFIQPYPIHNSQNNIKV